MRDGLPKPTLANCPTRHGQNLAVAASGYSGASLIFGIGLIAAKLPLTRWPDSFWWKDWSRGKLSSPGPRRVYVGARLSVDPYHWFGGALQENECNVRETSDRIAVVLRERA